MQETVDLLNEFDMIYDKFAEPMDDEEMNKLLERQGRFRRNSMPKPGTSIPGWRWQWMRCAVPPARPR